MKSGIVHDHILVNIIDYENQLVSSIQFLNRKYPEFWIYFDIIHHMSAKREINVLRCTIDCSFFLKSCRFSDKIMIEANRSDLLSSRLLGRFSFNIWIVEIPSFSWYVKTHYWLGITSKSVIMLFTTFRILTISQDTLITSNEIYSR